MESNVDLESKMTLKESNIYNYGLHMLFKNTFYNPYYIYICYLSFSKFSFLHLEFYRMLHSFFEKFGGNWNLEKKKSQQTDCDSSQLHLRSLLSFHEELKTNVIFQGNTGNSWHASLLSCLQPLSF